MNRNPQEFTEITVATTRKKCTDIHIDDDIILFDEIGKLPFPTDARRMKCIFTGLCLHGKAQYAVDTVEHMVTPNDAIVISPGQVVDSYMVSPDFSGIGFMLSQDFFCEIAKDVHELSSLFLFARTRPVSALQPEEAATFREYFQILKQKIGDEQHHFRKDVVRMTIATMIYDLGNTIYRIMSATNKQQSRADAIFADFIGLVERNFRTERRVGWYGQQLCITPKYLSETIKQVSQRTPNEWIDRFVTMEIRVLLKNSRKPIKEIAKELNFPNQSFLGKFFKEHVGMSPSEYRKG